MTAHRTGQRRATVSGSSGCFSGTVRASTQERTAWYAASSLALSSRPNRPRKYVSGVPSWPAATATRARKTVCVPPVTVSVTWHSR